MNQRAAIAEIKSLLARIEKFRDEAERYEISAGRKLAELKAAKPKGVTWPAYVREHFNLSRERADELIRIGEGQTTVEAVRAGTKARVAKTRAKQKSVLRNTGFEPEPEPADEADEPANPATIWARSLEYNAGQAIALQSQWKRDHGEAWRKFPAGPELVKLAAQAADAWAEISRSLQERASPQAKLKRVV